ncbi:hypothetical protein D088_670033 [Salmonella enterica subsp. houtenae serovar 16:z4,z32:-- str. RKS3027]|nr:hypothetical protein D088_670033 [Salmonella enterica subsp. houtenae serovar 16:z4,z32:-- str. RKS3027]
MCQAGQPRQYHNTINKLILRDILTIPRLIARLTSPSILLNFCCL